MSVLSSFPFINLANMSNGWAFGVPGCLVLNGWLGQICCRMVDAVDVLVHVQKANDFSR